MELSEKRKERLKALCIGAVQLENTDGHPGPATPSHLMNPLIQSPASPPVAEKSPMAPRFDYYTDPMSAYSGTKRRGSSSGHHQRDNFSSPLHSRTSTPLTYLPTSCSAGPRTHAAPTPASLFQVNYSAQGWTYESPPPGPQYAPWRSPVSMAEPLSRHSPVGMPGIPEGSGSTSGYGLPHSASRAGFMSPGLGRGTSPRTHPGRGSPSTNSGRGRGSPFNSGRGSNWRSGSYHRSPHSGRGNGWQGASACEKPELFFSKLMTLDPWDGLEPVVGCILDATALQKTPGSPRSWLPKSLTSKKTKVSEAASAPKSGPSLAEYIALSLEEALNDETMC